MAKWSRVVAVMGALGSAVIVLAQTSAPVSNVDALIAQMTIDEKIAMIHGGQDLGQRRAGGLHAWRAAASYSAVATHGRSGRRPAPAIHQQRSRRPSILAATFSPALAQTYGAVMGREARAHNQDVLLAPMVNIVRVPQAGRNFETLGEDPFLAGQIVAAEIAGIQSAGTIATVKHFAENNQENARQSVSADVDERTMREVELPGFEAAVKAHVGSIMASYNKVNGVYASENAMLETDILRKNGDLPDSRCPTGARRTATWPPFKPASTWKCQAATTTANSPMR